MRYTFKPSRESGCVDVCAEGVTTHYGEGICDRFALYESQDTWQVAAREYIEECNGEIVSESPAEIVAEIAG